MTTADWFLNGMKHAVTDVDWDADTIKVALLANTATIDQDADEFFSAVSADEVTGTGYTAGGQALVTTAPAVDAATNQLRFDATDAVWDATGGALTARYAVVYKDTGTAATSPLLGWVNNEADVTATNDTYTIAWDATGVLKMTAA